MRRTRGIALAIVAGALALVAAPASAATFKNFSFEAQVEGWNFYDAGTGGHFVCEGGITCAPQAVHGNHYVRLESGDPNLPVAAWQSVDLEAGEMISGSALFQTNEDLFNDSASVRILAGTTLVAVPWSATVFAPGPPGWRTWTYTAPVSGSYTVRYEVTNAVDRFVDSIAHFDSVETTITARGALIDSLSPTLRFEARLTRTDNGQALSGERIVFSVGGTEVCSAFTTTNGTATCGALNVAALATAAAGGYTAEFDGSVNGLPTEQRGGIIGL